VWNGQNKVLFRRLLHAAARPDCFLVVTRSDEVGHLDLTTTDWKSDDSLLISFSESHGQQEALLLMLTTGSYAANWALSSSSRSPCNRGLPACV